MENKTKCFLFILLQIFLVAKAQHWDDSMGSMFGPPPDLDFYIREGDPYYHAVCTAKDRCVTTCTVDYQDGCVCYKDGTCVEQSVNRCHQCTDANVFAVFEGQRCPKRHPFICHHFHHHHRRHHQHRLHHRHHKRDHGMENFCKVEKFSSCVCTENGDCSTKIIDLCNDCSNGSYLAVFLNSTCPDKSLKAVCNKTAGSNPPPTTCSYPYAYLCQAQDRNSTTCDLESAPQGCVCYSNGNCVSQTVSACACQRPDIVSVYTGGFCPTNCTGTPTPNPTPAEQSEEGESESSNEETTPGNEENNEGESSEGESSVVLDNLQDEFSSKNPYRVLNCTLSGAYKCQNSDRNASNCSRISSNSCICDNNGSCISVFTNRCNACSKNDVATIYENGFCPSNCSASTKNSSASTNNSNASTNNSNASTNNSSASTNNSGNYSGNSNTNSNVSPSRNANTNSNDANTNGNNPDSNNSPNGNNNMNNNFTPETGEGGNAPIPPTAAVPARNFEPNRQ